MSAPRNEVLLEQARAALVAADGLLSLVGYRFPNALPDDLGDELIACSTECRKIAQNIERRGGETNG